MKSVSNLTSFAGGEITKLVDTYYQTVAANAWEQATTFTLTKPAIVRVLSQFNNSASKGVAVGMTNNYALSIAHVEDDSFSIQSITILLEAGTYYVFTKHQGATNDQIIVLAYIIND